MTDVQKDFISLLEHEIALADSLIKVLEEEKIALTERQFEQLENLSETKQSLAGQLEDAQKRLMQLVGQTDITRYKQSLHDFLITCSQECADKINVLNNEFAEKLNLCREINLVNGQVITSNLVTRREIVSALTGQENAGKPDTYTASGNVKPTAGSIRHQKA
ncbi:flagella synthesis protein FlgN [Legionella spiritensis]|uniref:Flagellar biosynthesis/type III secretory pathway chaperone n=1 Tax=Legionella spiritensis TaxID=452 RepID=A0A0W0Z6Q9_LEGSP|nr:flagellar protein FlgN [Legionella spiritensis]KTD64809.1 flagellar biosynthesis/type III secretory pathway chaperone [Legionella spiritensis]SNV40350.1 flagella synthesis protein FlgN [Legionella spiritensis]VEG90450.1 flagella synthesis protein FlgN [Legionella spiritensis]